MTGGAAMRFDRRVSDVLMEALVRGPLEPLRLGALGDPTLDLQLRTEGTTSRATWYLGLTAILQVDERLSRFRVSAHASYETISPDVPWKTWRSEEWLGANASLLVEHLEAVEREVDPRFVEREGLVSASLAANRSAAYRLVQREALPAFESKAHRTATFDRLAAPLEAAVRSAGDGQPWWPGIRDRGVWPKTGGKLDALAVDSAGHLLAIEAKAADNLKGVVFAPVQVRVYACLIAEVVEAHGVAAIDGMLGQRVQLGLAASGPPVEPGGPVQPVVAIGPGSLSGVALTRLAAVAAALPPAPPSVGPLEVWLIDGDGEPVVRWKPEEEPVPEPPLAWFRAAPTPTPRDFVARARSSAIEWKSSTTTLGETPLAPGSYAGRGEYPFCLPPSAALLNLLPEAREVAVERFAAAHIPWHRGVDDGPTNHLLSSQIQCANVLAPFVDDGPALGALFGGVLDIAEVLPFGATTSSPFDATDHVVFEWIGLQDYLGELKGGVGTRGAHNTSSDAAIRYRTSTGRVEVALIEWKYTEQYLGHELSGGPTANQVRMQRYRPLWDDPCGPVRTDVIPYEDLFVEPFYQLFRLQQLAWKMEQSNEVGAERVRLVYVAPSANAELWRSLNRPSHRHPPDRYVPLALPEDHTVLDLWRAMLRRPDRFVYLDSASLVLPSSPCSAELKARYNDLKDGVRSFSEPADVAGRFVEVGGLGTSIVQRVFSDGSVLQHLLESDNLDAVPGGLLAEAINRIEEIAELARRLRAEVLSQIVDEGGRVDPVGPND